MKTTTTTWDVAQRIRDALSTRSDSGAWPTVAQDRWYMPRDWPVEDALVPIGKISSWEENKESLGRSGIKFTTTGTVEVIGEVSCPGEPDAQTAGKLLTALALYQREIELAVLGDPILFGGDTQGLIQEMLSVVTKTATTSQGQVGRGAISMTFEFSFYQGEEDFQQQPMTDVDRFHIYADLINVADPTGTYTPSMNYTPVPAPRDHGPDGRNEGEAGIEV